MHHNSVAGPMIFPLKSIENLVPASLHINLGLVLYLYDMLLGECKRIDMEGGLDLLTEERTKLEQEWEITSLLLVDGSIIYILWLPF